MRDKLHEACFALDAIGEKAVNDLRTWFVSYMLEPYQDLFAPGKPDANLENTKRRFAWFKRILKDATEGQNALFDIFPSSWQMDQLQTNEFCRITKLHLDQILNENQSQYDVSQIIEAMQKTIEFEAELVKRYPPEGEPAATRQEEQKSQVSVIDGKVEVAASGSAAEIKQKYAKEKDEDQRNQEVFAKIQKKKEERKGKESRIKGRVYKFEGVISECFEPYLMSYSD